LNLPDLYMAPPFMGVTQLEFRRDLWQHKDGVPNLSYDVVCVILCLAVLIQQATIALCPKPRPWPNKRDKFTDGLLDIDTGV